MDCYFLRRDVFFCGRGESIVFLDLRRDLYTMLVGEHARQFKDWVARVSIAPGSDLDAPHSALDELVAQGVLTRDAQEGKPVAPADIELPARTFVTSSNTASPRIAYLDVLRFGVSCTMAAVKLRFCSIRATVTSVAKRKAGRAEQSRSDLDQARVVVAKFNKLRAFFPVKFLCLFDSLALIEFLSCYGLFPAWTFAVRIEPWAAHCWVQQGDYLFNEEIEEAEDYMPIMSV